MSSSEGEAAMKDLTDEADNDRLQKDMDAMKHDISNLADQVADALDTLAGSAQKQARRGYQQARSNVDSAVSDRQARQRGASAGPGRSSDARRYVGRCNSAATNRGRRTCLGPGLADRDDLASLRTLRR
jgi:hypothetical protein